MFYFLEKWQIAPGTVMPSPDHLLRRVHLIACRAACATDAGVDGSRWAPRTSNLLFRQLPVGRRVRLPCTPANFPRVIAL